MSAQRERFAEALAQKPVGPSVAPIRDLYLKFAESAVSRRVNVAEAYLANLKAVQHIIAGRGAKSGAHDVAAGSQSTGSLGEEG